jgi:hypothetical protein
MSQGGHRGVGTRRVHGSLGVQPVETVGEVVQLLGEQVPVAGPLIPIAQAQGLTEQRPLGRSPCTTSGSRTPPRSSRSPASKPRDLRDGNLRRWRTGAIENGLH